MLGFEGAPAHQPIIEIIKGKFQQSLRGGSSYKNQTIINRQFEIIFLTECQLK